MGRSVVVLNNAEAVAYVHQISEDNEAYDDWNDFVDTIRDILRTQYISFNEADRWIEQECRVILENDHAKVTVSEYGGIAAIALVPKSHGDCGHPELSEAWCQHVAGNWTDLLNKAFGTSALISLGSMSNGETVYRAANA